MPTPISVVQIVSFCPGVPQMLAVVRIHDFRDDVRSSLLALAEQRQDDHGGLRVRVGTLVVGEHDDRVRQTHPGGLQRAVPNGVSLMQYTLWSEGNFCDPFSSTRLLSTMTMSVSGLASGCRSSVITLLPRSFQLQMTI